MVAAAVFAFALFASALFAFALVAFNFAPALRVPKLAAHARPPFRFNSPTTDRTATT